MARSRRKRPIRGITTADSEKQDKCIASRRERHRNRQILDYSLDDTLLMPRRQAGNPWLMNKDETAMAEIVFNYEDEKEAEAIVKAVAPDNAKLPPGLIIKTTRKGSSVVTRTFCAKGVETLLATLDDLFSCIQVAENVLRASKSLSTRENF